MNQKVLSDEISVTDPWRARCIRLDDRVGLLSPVEFDGVGHEETQAGRAGLMLPIAHASEDR